MKFKQKLSAFIFICITIIPVFFSCRNDEKQDVQKKDSSLILIAGSESELKLIRFLTDEYKKNHSGIKIEVIGGGSSRGIDALINGKIDIANSSRLITTEELAQAKRNGISISQVVIATDAVSIITNPRVEIDSLSLTQISGLLSGQIKNWKEIGGADMPVIVIGRDENSGTYRYLLDHFHLNGYAEGAQQKAGNEEIVAEVSRKQGAIGYVNLGFVYDENNIPCKNVWVASIYFEGSHAYSPYQTEYVNNGEYPLTRPLYQYLSAPASGMVNDLVKFELSDSTQIHLHELGYFPIKSIYQTINTKNGFN